MGGASGYNGGNPGKDSCGRRFCLPAYVATKGVAAIPRDAGAKAPAAKSLPGPGNRGRPFCVSGPIVGIG